METRSLGRYEIRGELGRGSMGVVYRGYDPVIDREVALKTISLPTTIPAVKRTAYLERFLQEARIAGRLNHPNIVVTYDAAADNDLPFIAMELVEGESLSKRIEANERLPWPEAVEIMIPIARALDYAHRNGIVHRDVKPANILVTSEGVPKLTDFGIARLPTSQLTGAGVLMGTPSFISPEQLRGKAVDGRADVFCLGAVLYNLVVGRPPFEGEELSEIFHQVVCADPPPPSRRVAEIPPALDQIIAKALAKAPAERFTSGKELAEALDALRSGATPALGDSSATTAVLGPRRRSRMTRRVALLGLALLVGGSLVLVAVGEQRRLEYWDRAAGTSLAAWAWVSEKIGLVESSVRDDRIERDRRARLQEQAGSRLGEGRAKLELGHWAEALTAITDSLEAYQQAGDGVGEASSLQARGILMARTGDWSKARADLETAASVSRVYADATGEIAALCALANVESALGEGRRADELLRQAMVRASTLDVASAGSSIWIEQTWGDVLEGRWEATRRRLDGPPPLNDPELQVRAAVTRGVLAVVLDDGDGAQAAWHDAAARCDNVGSHTPRLELRLWQGRAALLAGDTATARSELEQAESGFRRLGHLPGLAAALENLAEAARQEGDLEAAQARTDEASEIRGELGLAARPTTDGDLGVGPRREGPAPAAERLVFVLGATPRTSLSEQQLLTARRRALEADG